jgi:hypothetical protein
MTTQSCLGRIANLLVLYAPRSFSSVLRLVASFRPSAAGPLGPRSLCRFLLLNPSAASLSKKISRKIQLPPFSLLQSSCSSPRFIFALLQSSCSNLRLGSFSPPRLLQILFIMFRSHFLNRFVQRLLDFMVLGFVFFLDEILLCLLIVVSSFAEQRILQKWNTKNLLVLLQHFCSVHFSLLFCFRTGSFPKSFFI